MVLLAWERCHYARTSLDRVPLFHQAGQSCPGRVTKHWLVLGAVELAARKLDWFLRRIWWVSHCLVPRIDLEWSLGCRRRDSPHPPLVGEAVPLIPGTSLFQLFLLVDGIDALEGCLNSFGFSLILGHLSLENQVQRIVECYLLLVLLAPPVQELVLLRESAQRSLDTCQI